MENQLTTQKELFHQHYKQHAGEYDNLRDQRCRTTKLTASDQINFVLNHFEGIEKIVEVGCGTGKFTIPLAKAGKKVIAIDYAEEMLDIVREKASHQGLADRIELRHGDIENLDIKSNSAKAVLSIAVLRHFEDETKGLSELTRILDDSGILIIDYLSSFFFKPYDLLKRTFTNKQAIKGHQWFPNYYRSFQMMEKNLKVFNCQIVQKKGFVLLPTNITEKLHLTAPLKYIENKTGLGGVVFIVARKIK